MMWVAAAWAAALPVAALSLGLLHVRRDLFFLMVYAQVWLYVHVGPTLAAGDVSAGALAQYTNLSLWALPLLDGTLVVVYLAVVRGIPTPLATPRVAVSRPLTLAFAFGTLLLGLGHVVVAAARGLLYRRIGVEIAALQLSLPLPEFAIYRLFVELGPFLIGTHVLLWRYAGDRATRNIAALGAAGSILLFLVYALVNSRLSAVVALAVAFGLYTTTSSQARHGLRRVGAAAVVAVAALYFTRVVANVRRAHDTGGSVFDVGNLDPFGSAVANSDAEQSLRWRINGLDLVALISDNVQSQGPAWGSAWAAPFVVSLDPFVRTPLTMDLKRAGLTTAKSFLLLRYAGWIREDYFSCMVSDAYGNFGLIGFTLVALALGLVFGLAARAISRGASPVGILVAAFALAYALPFEQETAHLLFGWLKLVPVLLAILAMNPLRRGAGQRQVPIPAHALPARA